MNKIKKFKNKIQLKKREKNELIYDESLEKYNEKYEKLKFFKDLSENIENIYDSMNALRTKESTSPISIRVDISYPNVKYFLGKDEKEFQEFVIF